MRFCHQDGKLDFHYQCKIGMQPPEYIPWFKVPTRKVKNVEIIFGHWAALEGEIDEPHMYALDTGCVWGKGLTAMRLEDKKVFQVNCENSTK